MGCGIQGLGKREEGREMRNEYLCTVGMERNGVLLCDEIVD